MQQTRAYTRTRSGIASHAVAGGDIGVGAVIDIEQRTLCTFEQQVGAQAVCIVEFARHIGHHGLQELCMFHGFFENHVKLDFTIFDIRLECIAKDELL